MKLFSSILAAALLSASSASLAAPAAQAFFCPSDDVVEATLVSLLPQLKPFVESSPIQTTQKEGFYQTITMGMPSSSLVTTAFEFAGKSYEIVAVAGSFYDHNDYPDLTAAIFEAGQSQVVGILSTDTDRSIVRCKAVVNNKAAYISMSAADFDWVAERVAQGGAVYKGESFQNYVSLTPGLAQATDKLGLPVIFIRGQ